MEHRQRPITAKAVIRVKTEHAPENENALDDMASLRHSLKKVR
jgi:hypothetical protein